MKWGNEMSIFQISIIKWTTNKIIDLKSNSFSSLVVFLWMNDLENRSSFSVSNSLYSPKIIRQRCLGRFCKHVARMNSNHCKICFCFMSFYICRIFLIDHWRYFPCSIEKNNTDYLVILLYKWCIQRCFVQSCWNID